MKKELLKKVNDRSLIVGVVGLGYVGLPLAVENAKAGYKTIGFDVQASKVDMVNAGQNYIGDIMDMVLEKLVKEGKLSASADFSRLNEVDFIAICVPTPLDEHQEPNMSYVETSVKTVAKYLKKRMIVVLESTTYPGTTEGIVKSILENESGLKCGEDFYLGFSPERVDPGNKKYNTQNTPKVVGGIGADATEVIAALYRNVIIGEIKKVSSPAVAEMEKILENTYRNINIALVNELAMCCHKMGISIWEVIDAAKTKPYGFEAFYPGPGLGGHCIPLDPYYLSWKAREFRFHTSLIEISGIINDRMPEYCVLRCAEFLNRMQKAVKGAVILILGVAYKADIDDYRESPALEVIEEFKKRGAKVKFYDPWIAEYHFKGETYQGLKELSVKEIIDSDLVVIITAHTNVDYGLVQRHSKAIFDARNAMKNLNDKSNIEVL